MTKTASTRTPANLQARGPAFESSTPLQILEWAVNEFGDGLTFATGFSTEGCVLIDLIERHHLPIDIFTLDAGLLFPETSALRHRLEDRYGLSIRRVTPPLTLEQQASAHGPGPWSRESDLSCEVRKVSPLVAELSSFKAWNIAIRRDQTSARAAARTVEWDAKFKLAGVNPLVRSTRKDDVWSYVQSRDVPYNPLHDHGFPSIGYHPWTSRVANGQAERAGRWRGDLKIECGLHGPALTSSKRVVTSSHV